MYYIDKEKCQGCGRCITVCPEEAIDWVKTGPHDVCCEILTEYCIDCGKCKEWCLWDAVIKVE